MAATKEELREWFIRGQEQNATHMIVVDDTFDHEDYPVYVSKEENVEEKAKEHHEDMQRVMEVYDLTMDIEDQMKEPRAFHGVDASIFR